MLQEWIEVQFNRLQELADQMQTTADQIRLLADEKICQLLLETKLCWMGESADLFMEREVRFKKGGTYGRGLRKSYVLCRKMQ